MAALYEIVNGIIYYCPKGKIPKAAVKAEPKKSKKSKKG